MIHFHFNKKLANATKVTLNESMETDVWIENKNRTLAIGIGPRKEVTHRKLILILRQIIATAKAHKIASLELEVKDFRFEHLPLTPAELGELMAVNFEMANYEFDKYKTLGKDEQVHVKEVNLLGAGEGIEQGIKKGQIIGAEVNATRTLSNTPPGLMTPKSLAQAAKVAAKKTKAKVTVLGRKEMQKLKMGAILGVAQGSAEEPQFIIAEYFGDKKTENPVVLVGKGVTFDSGGLNLKPSNYIYEMHMDMSGGAAVIHAVIAAAKLKLKCNVIALVPTVENMPSGSSYRPGDVLTSMSGKTIEVLNTDAEGRVILADALTYAARYHPKLVVDVATLTGAAEVALGKRASAIFSKDEKLIEQVRALGEKSGDYVWPLPLWDEYEADIKGTFGDWANVGKIDRAGGAITGAMFLYQFAKTYSWLHIDMAPTMTAIEGEHLAKGAAGSPVRLLIKLLEVL